MHKSIFEAVTIPQEQFAQKAHQILGDMADLLERKNADYGGASMDMGMTGIVVHLHDKERRLVSLTDREARGEAPNFEGINDTLRDMIGYATIGLIIRTYREATPHRLFERPVAHNPITLMALFTLLLGELIEQKQPNVGDVFVHLIRQAVIDAIRAVGELDVSDADYLRTFFDIKE